LRTHDGILLKRLLSRGQLHNLVYSLAGRDFEPL